ncbi:MAG TPA: ATP synthase F1 subunit epsilon [Thermodesulfobacteriota bacterium]
MADKVLLEVVTPSMLVLKEEVDEVVAPGELGEFGVLPGHVPFISLLIPGELRYIKGGVERRYIISGGVAEVREDKVNILTDRVEDPASIHIESARMELEAILEELKNFSGRKKELEELDRRLKLAQIRANVKE